MTNDQFSDPGERGDQLPVNDLVGSLLLVTVHEETQPINTVHGTNTAIRADVATLDGDLKSDVFTDVLIFQRILKTQLRGSIGGKVLGRLELGEKKPGKNPPFQLATVTDADREVGRRYLAYVATQQPVATPAAGAGGGGGFAAEEPFIRDAQVADL